jgi:FkbH-like protein
MWETEWAKAPEDRLESFAERLPSQVVLDDIEAVRALCWGEYCVECAAPDCYSTCSIFVPRGDGRCVRLRYGIHPNANFAGLFGYGADVHFRRWAKLQSTLRYGAVTPDQAKRFARWDRLMLNGVVNPGGWLLRPVGAGRKPNRAYARWRQDASAWYSRGGRNGDGEEMLLVEAWSPNDFEFNLIVETEENEQIRCRLPLPMRPGHNLHRVPCSQLNVDLVVKDGKIRVFPENDQEVRLVFGWLDIVRRRSNVARPSAPALDSSTSAAAELRPAEKVKCVVWDLDHTLWDGVLLEDGPERVVPSQDALDLVRALDERGIIQSIASKNDHEAVWPLVERLSLADHFLYPAIHWGPKSESIQRIAEALNIGIDAIAFIDDSTFERGEVAEHLPQVRVYDAREVPRLLERSEFQVPITEASRLRRHSYLADAQRKRIEQQFSSNHVAFLSGCELVAQVFVPREPRHIDRCLELIQRSNQLNLSTHRYERDDLLRLLDDPAVICLATTCRDRFGDYGLVGFSSIRMPSTVTAAPLMIDFVLSCRVARKMLEQAWFAWLCGALRQRDFSSLCLRFVPSARNGVLRRVLDDIGFTERQREDQSLILELPFDRSIADRDVVTVVGDASLPVSDTVSSSPAVRTGAPTTDPDSIRISA